jgi:hypothetical protein
VGRQILNRALAGTVAANASKDTVNQVRDLAKNWDSMSPKERSAALTGGTLSSVMAGLSGYHAVMGSPVSPTHVDHPVDVAASVRPAPAPTAVVTAPTGEVAPVAVSPVEPVSTVVENPVDRVRPAQPEGPVDRRSVPRTPLTTNDPDTTIQPSTGRELRLGNQHAAPLQPGERVALPSDEYTTGSRRLRLGTPRMEAPDLGQQARAASEAAFGPMKRGGQPIEPAKQPPLNPDGTPNWPANYVKTFLQDTDKGGSNYTDADLAALKNKLGIKKSYGSENKLVSSDAASQAAIALRDKMTRSNVGFDPTMLADAAKIGAYHFEAGARQFADWSGKMVDQLGDAVRPHLQDIWDSMSSSNLTGREAARAQQPVQTVLPGMGVDETNQPDLRPDVDPFYSKAARVLDDKVQGKAGAGNQILATLRNNGVKDDEIKWTGLDDFLKDKPKVSKAEVQQFLQDNQIKLGEKNLTDKDTSVKSLQTDQRNLHDYLSAVRGRNPDSSLAHAMSDWFSDEGAESTAKLLSHPDMTPEIASAITRYDQLDEQIKQGGSSASDGPSKYSKYVLDGPKDNYTEKLMTLPSKGGAVKPSTDAAVAYYGFQKQLQNKYGANESSSNGIYREKVTPEERAQFDQLQRSMFAEDSANKAAINNSGAYKSGHFDEPNILAHVRHDDRTDTDGKKNLFLEEVQSDWHQQGKQEGYQTAPSKEQTDALAQSKAALAAHVDKVVDRINGLRAAASPEVRAANGITGPYPRVDPEAVLPRPVFDAMTSEEKDQYNHLQRNVRTADSLVNSQKSRGVPQAPFKNDWHELAMKRMLREAAEKGYDRLSWTTGEQQADRYDLTHHIGRVTYDPESNNLVAYDPRGNQVVDENVDNDPEELAKYIGKEPAKKLAAQIENYEPDRGPSIDDLSDHYASKYEVREIEPEDEDSPTMYGVFASYDHEPLETFESEREAGRARQHHVENEIQSEIDNYEPADPELPEIRGLDLKVGGEWAHNLYDRAIPNFMNKYLKKWGGKVGTTSLSQPGADVYQDAGTLKWHVSGKDTPYNSQKEAEQHAPGQNVHSIDITPAMRKAFMKEGQPIARVEPQSDLKNKLNDRLTSALA